MLKTGDVRCPICNDILEEYGSFDIEVDISCVRLSKVGKCPNCSHEYKWCEEFTYDGYTTPEEVDDEYEPNDIDDDCGFDPYEGCYTYDC